MKHQNHFLPLSQTFSAFDTQNLIQNKAPNGANQNFGLSDCELFGVEIQIQA